MEHTTLPALSPATRTVLAAAYAVGGRPLIVGGALRDGLLGLAPKDVDVEVHGVSDPNLLEQALSRVGVVDVRGRCFGVLSVRVGEEDFDVSLPRRDSKTASGHRGFQVSVDADLSVAEAFGRRDFTVNSIGWDTATGELVDPFGGRADLEAGVLRATDPRRFAEDPLRVFRAVQFACRFGFTVQEATAVLCRRVVETILDEPGLVARERVWGEWRKMLLTGTHWVAGFAALESTGVGQLFPQLWATRGVAQDTLWHPEGDVFTHLALSAEAAALACERESVTADDRLVAVLGSLVHDFGKVTHTQQGQRITSHGHAGAGVASAEAFLTRLGVPARVVARVLPVVAEHMRHTAVTGAPSAAAVRRLVRALAPATLTDWARVVDADCAGRDSGAKDSPTPAWLAAASDGGVPAKPLLTGAHLIALGLSPGPGFKPILKDALAAQDDGVFADTAGAIVWAHERVGRL